MPDPHLPKSVQHRCHPDGECFCVYDPECNPNAKATRLIPAEVTDEMVERVAVAMVGNGDPDYWRCLSEPQREWHRGRARRALDAAFRICAMRGDEPPRTEATDRQAPRRPEPLDAEAHAMTEEGRGDD